MHWRDLPVALAPEKDQLAPDGIWSGSATYDEDGLPVLFFTAGNDSASPNQSVALARSTYSQDGDPELVHWVKHPVPLIVQKKGMGVYGDFRIRSCGRTKRMVCFGRVRDRRRRWSALAFASQDMLNWTYKGPLFKADIQKFPYLGPIWELPVLLPWRDKQEWISIFTGSVGQGADVEVFY